MKAATPTPYNLASLAPRVDPASIVHYLGLVNYATSERVLAQVRALVAQDVEPTLVVTSAGGPSGTAMALYDTVRTLMRAAITTIGSGDVDSSGMVVFLSGTRRYVTAHTTALLHPAGRTFEPGVRYTQLELAAMLAEDCAKDELYADILANNSTLSAAEALNLMKMHTILTASDFVRLGLAEAVL